MDDDTQIASEFTVGKYRQIRPSLDVAAASTVDWQTILDAFDRRIQERFLRPIRELEKYDEKSLKEGRGPFDGENLPFRPGAAILALDCLLIDTIQSFREGRGTVPALSPARSFKDFLKNSKGFSGFTSKDREDFFGDVRNGLLHNGETRGNWKFRIDVPELLSKQKRSRTINRRIFHERVISEFDRLYESLKLSDGIGAKARERFLHRMDAICGMDTPDCHYYFAYGSNLLEREISRDVKNFEMGGKAFLPRYRLEFSKHAFTRNCDAASIRPDDSSIVWGVLYRVSDAGKQALTNREKGYCERAVIVSVVDGEDVSPQRAFTFVGAKVCSGKCGPSKEYLALVVEGAKSRDLPPEYVQEIQARHSEK